MEDEQIIALLWDRKESGIALLQEKYEKYCMAVAGRIVGWEDARECVNDAWLKAWQSIPPKRPESLAGYLAKITRNLALHHYEKQHAAKRGGGQAQMCLEELQECVPDSDQIEEHLNEAALKEVIEGFLRKKDATKRTIFLQRYFYMAGLSEIAENVGMKESSVRSALSRMRRELCAVLKKEGIWI